MIIYRTQTITCNPIRNRSFCSISASWSKPQSEVGRKLIHLQTGVVKLIRKLIIKIPEGAVIRPSIVYNIRIKRSYPVLCESFLNLEETLLNNLVRDLLHVVVPWVVLLTELRIYCDRLDIFIEIALCHAVISASGSSYDSVPRRHLSVFVSFVILKLIIGFQWFSIVVTDKGIRTFNFVLCLRELTSPVHRTYIVRLSKLQIIAFHSAHVRIVRHSVTDRPVFILFQISLCDVHIFQIDIIDLRFFCLPFPNRNIEVFSHERISVFHRDHFFDRVIYTSYSLRLKRKRQRFHSVLFCQLRFALHFHFARLKLCRVIHYRERRCIFKKVKFRTAGYVFAYICSWRFITINKLNTNILRCHFFVQVHICFFFIFKRTLTNQFCTVCCFQSIDAIPGINLITFHMPAHCGSSILIHSLLIAKRLERLLRTKIDINIMRILFHRCIHAIPIFRMIICIIITVEHLVCSAIRRFILCNAVRRCLPTCRLQLFLRRYESAVFLFGIIVKRVDYKLFTARLRCEHSRSSGTIVCNLFCWQYFVCAQTERSFQIFVSEDIRTIVLLLKSYSTALFLRRLPLLCRSVFCMNRLSHKRKSPAGCQRYRENRSHSLMEHSLFHKLLSFFLKCNVRMCSPHYSHHLINDSITPPPNNIYTFYHFFCIFFFLSMLFV